MRAIACRATARLGKGTGNVPSLVDGKLASVTPGEVFWFITRGDKDNGMPSWAQLPAKQRWQIVTYVKSMGASPAAKEASAPAPPDVSYIEAERTAADAALHRLPLREAGHGAQDHSERSAATVCDAIGEQRSRTCSTAGKCLAGDASWIQGGTVCRGARQSADLAHGSERRHFSDGKRCRTHPGVPRHDQRRETRAVSHIRQRPEAVPTVWRSILPVLIRNGYTWATSTKWFASLITMAT